MISLRTIDLTQIDVAPNPAIVAGGEVGHCVGHNGPIHTHMSLLALVAGQLVCPTCVSNYWGKQAAEILSLLSARYVRSQYATVQAALAAAGDRFLKNQERTEETEPAGSRLTAAGHEPERA